MPMSLPEDLVEQARREREQQALSPITSSIDRMIREGMGGIESIAKGAAEQAAPVVKLLQGGELKLPTLDDLTPQWMRDQYEPKPVQQPMVQPQQQAPASGMPQAMPTAPQDGQQAQAAQRPMALPTGSEGGDYGPIDNSSRAAFVRTAYPYMLEAAGGDKNLAELMLAKAISENGDVGSGGGFIGNNFCYDGATEVLTSDGWVRWPDADLRHRFATLNPLTEAIEYQRASYLTRSWYSGRMFRVATDHVNLLVTPEHRMWVRPTPDAPYQIIRARDLSGRRVEYMAPHLPLGDLVHGANVDAEASCDFRSDRSSSEQAADFPYIGFGQLSVAATSAPVPSLRTHVGKVIGLSALKEMIGAHAGRVVTAMANLLLRRQRYGVSQCERETMGKDVLLAHAGAESSVPLRVGVIGPDPTRPEFGADDRPVFADLRPESLLGRSEVRAPASAATVTGVAALDGLRQGEKVFAASLADARNGTLLGHRLSPSGGVTPRPSDTRCGALRRKNYTASGSWTSYDGMVYCATVPNGLLVVRRDGKVVVSGNSGIKGEGDAGSFEADTWEDYGNGRVNIRDRFAAYSTPQVGFRAFMQFLHDNSRYAPALARYQQTGDASQLFRDIRAAGYATDPLWADKVENIRANQVAPIVRGQADQDMQRLSLNAVPAAAPGRTAPPAPAGVASAPAGAPPAPWATAGASDGGPMLLKENDETAPMGGGDAMLPGDGGFAPAPEYDPRAVDEGPRESRPAPILPTDMTVTDPAYTQSPTGMSYGPIQQGDVQGPPAPERPYLEQATDWVQRTAAPLVEAATNAYGREISEGNRVQDEIDAALDAKSNEFANMVRAPIDDVRRGVNIANRVLMATPQATADVVNAALERFGLGRDALGVDLPLVGRIGIADIVDLGPTSNIGMGRTGMVQRPAQSIIPNVGGAIEDVAGAGIRAAREGIRTGAEALGRGLQGVGREVAGGLMDLNPAMTPRVIGDGGPGIGRAMTDGAGEAATIGRGGAPVEPPRVWTTRSTADTFDPEWAPEGFLEQAGIPIAAPRRPKPDDDLFHLTSRDNLERVAREGLTPTAGDERATDILLPDGSRTVRRPAVYAADNAPILSTVDRDMAGTVEWSVLRFKRGNRGWRKDPEFATDPGSWVTRRSIPAAEIEVLTSDGWRPVTEVARTAVEPPGALSTVASPGPRGAGIGTRLATDAGNALAGSMVGAIAPADTPEERLRNTALGAAGFPIAGRLMRRAGGALGTPGIGPNGRPVQRTVEWLAEQIDYTKRVLDDLDPATEGELIGQVQDRLGRLQGEWVDAVNARRALEPRIRSEVGRRAEDMPVHERLAGNDYPMVGQERVSPEAGIPTTRDDTPRSPGLNSAVPFDPASAAAGGAAGAMSEGEDGEQGDPLRTAAGILLAGVGGGMSPGARRALQKAMDRAEALKAAGKADEAAQVVDAALRRTVPGYDPRLSREPVLPGMEPPRRVPGDAGPGVGNDPNLPGNRLGNVPPSQLREPTFPGMEGPYTRPNIPDVPETPNRAPVLGDVPPSAIDQRALPGMDPVRDAQAPGPVGQSLALTPEQRTARANAALEQFPQARNWYERARMRNEAQMQRAGVEPQSPLRWLMDLVGTVSYSSMLGPGTMSVNLFTGALEPLWAMPKEVLRGAGRAVQQRNLSALREPLAMAGGAVHGMTRLGEALIDLAKSRGAYAPNPDFPMLSARTADPMARLLVQALEAPGKVWSALPDAIFGTISKHAGEAREAAQIATNKGLKGAEWKAEVTRLLEDARAVGRGELPTSTETQRVVDAGNAYAKRQSYRDELGTIGRKAEKVAKLGGLPVLGTWASPFFRTPWNAALAQAEKSPIGFAMNRQASRFDKHYDAILGTAAILGLAEYARQGAVTGSGPTDPKERELLQQKGWQPYSVLVGNTYVPTRMFAIFEGPLNAAGELHDAMAYRKQDADERANVTEAAQRIGKLIRQNPYALSGLVSLMELPSQGVAGFAAEQITRVTPLAASARTIGMAGDASERTTDRGKGVPLEDEIIQRWQLGVGARSGLPVAQDAFGQPKANERPGGWAAFPRMRNRQDSPEADIFLEAGVKIGDPKSEMSISRSSLIPSMPLKPSERRLWDQKRGDELLQAAREIAADPEWATAPKEIKQRVLRRVMDTAAKIADNEVKAVIGDDEINRRVDAEAAKKAS